MNEKAILQEVQAGIMEDCSLLKGCLDMYRAIGDPMYRDEVLRAMNTIISPEGEFTIQKPWAEFFSFGKALFLAWDETGEERYKIAAIHLASSLNNAALPEDPKQLYTVMPFWAEFDTRFGGKQAYKAIVNHCKMLREKYFDPEKKLYFFNENEEDNLTNEAFMLLMLVDTAEQMDKQLYEHYRALEDLFLEAVRGLLVYQTGPTSLFSYNIVQPGETVFLEDNTIIDCALLKGVRLGMLDEEKYLPIAIHMAGDMEWTIAAPDMLASDFPGPLGFRLTAEAELKEVKKQ